MKCPKDQFNKMIINKEIKTKIITKDMAKDNVYQYLK